MVPLSLFPLYLECYVHDHASIVSNFNRKVNNLFTFSSPSIEGHFKSVPAPSNVVITGRVYHQLRNIEQGQHSLRWFLYDKEERDRDAVRQSVPPAFLATVERCLNDVSSYARSLRWAVSTVSREQPLIIEILNKVAAREVAAGELAAIVHLTNLQEIHPRSVFIYWNDSVDAFGPKKVSILSPHYEPLQYSLLFPHGIPSWSPSASFSES